MSARTRSRALSLLLLGLAGAISIAALAQQPPPGNPPPNGASPNDASAAARASSNYMLSSQVDWIALLPPPPQADSPEQQRDIQAVLDMQAKYPKGSDRAQGAIDDSEGSCFRFADVLGKHFSEKKLDKTAEFLKKATADGSAAAAVVKNYWRRPRPYMVNTQVVRQGDMDPEYVKQKEAERKAKEEEERKKNPDKEAKGPAPNSKPVDPAEEKKKEAERQKETDNTSYPSGHSTLGTLCAIVLSQMVPEKQAELFARAETYRESRMIVGAHFRTDTEGGRALATAAAAVMSQNFAFQRDETEARAELRDALGLPTELPRRKTKKTERDDGKEERKKD